MNVPVISSIGIGFEALYILNGNGGTIINNESPKSFAIPSSFSTSQLLIQILKFFQKII